MPNTRGITNNARQAFIYRGIQIIPTIDGGWISMIGGRLYTESTEDEMCFAIDATHIMIEAVQHRSAFPQSGCAQTTPMGWQPTSAISAGCVRSPLARARRYSTSHKRGAA